MSGYEMHTGKLKLIDEDFNSEKLEELFKNDSTLDRDYLEEVLDYGHNTYTLYNDDFEPKYVVSGNKLFKIKKHKREYDAMHVDVLDKKGNFTFLFYNGGTCFSEMVEDAVEREYGT